LVGGLLVIADAPADDALTELHAQACARIGWPVRLHARELTDDLGHLVLWYDALVTRGAPPALGPDSDALVEAHAAWHQRVANRRSAWGVKAPPVRDAHRPTLKRLGVHLNNQVRDTLRDGLRAWCGPNRRAYLVAGHVADHEPNDEPTYVRALDAALGLASRLARRDQAGPIALHVAEFGSTRPERSAARIGGFGSVDVRPYDVGHPGLWLADTLLGWVRTDTIRSSVFHRVHGAPLCLWAGSAVDRAELLDADPPSTPFEYYSAAVRHADRALP
jgi:hypothetical protein